jgi:hypothetical protein
MTAVQGRVDARKVLLGKVVIVPCLTAKWAPKRARGAHVMVSRAEFEEGWARVG